MKKSFAEAEDSTQTRRKRFRKQSEHKMKKRRGDPLKSFRYHKKQH